MGRQEGGRKPNLQSRHRLGRVSRDRGNRHPSAKRPARHAAPVRSVSPGADSEREIASFGVERGPESAGYRPAHRRSCRNRLFTGGRGSKKRTGSTPGAIGGLTRARVSSGENAPRLSSSWPRDGQRAPAGLLEGRQVSPDRGWQGAFHACLAGSGLRSEGLVGAQRASHRSSGDGAPEVVRAVTRSGGNAGRGSSASHRGEWVVVETSRSPHQAERSEAGRTEARSRRENRVWLAEVGRTYPRCSRESAVYLIRRATVPTL